MKGYDEQFLKRWEQKREAGMLKFSLTSGGVFALAAIAGLILIEIYNGTLNEIFISGQVIERGVTYLALGAVFGVLMWYLNERKYKKLR